MMEAQLSLLGPKVARVSVSDSFWLDTRILPSYAAVGSLLVIIMSSILQTFRQHKAPIKVDEEPTNIGLRVRAIIKSSGIYLFLLRVLRVFLCIALLLLSIRSVDVEVPDASYVAEPYERSIIIAEAAFFAYTTCISIGTVVLPTRQRHIAIRHAFVLLLAEFGVYFYRDLYPLCTYTLQPMDIAEGGRLWTRVVMLAFASLVIPLVAPREYIPIDPKNPNDPNAEQTASALSIISFAFMDHLVYLGYKHPHVPFDLLPSLCDYDRGVYLNERGREYIRPSLAKRRRSFIWRLLSLFRVEFLVVITCTITRTIFGFLAPVSLNRILNYIETDGEGAIIRPWVWILIFFAAPVLASIFFQLYIFGATHLLAQVESVVTQAVFEHALRIRMKTTPNDDNSSSGVGPKQDNPNGGKAKNMEGKINNLISSDLENIVDAKDIMPTIFSSPLQTVMAITFLYTLLGWSALVGLTVLMLGMYVPGKITARIHAIQILQSKATDARVQYVTETLSAVRLIKMFGYEAKMEERISEKRHAEIKLVKRRYNMGLVNAIYNWLLPVFTMLVTFFTYTYFMGKPLTASTVFSSVAVFDSLRQELSRLNWTVPAFIAGKVSMDRLDEFFYETEMLDRFIEDDDNTITGFLPPVADPDAPGFHNAVFDWDSSPLSASETASAVLTPSSRVSSSSSSRRFRLQIPGDLQFQPGVLNLVLGPTGSGKTSMLLALLGEMHFVPSGPDSWYNLPKQNGVAYAAQSPWVLNRTIKDNILFGEDYNEERYRTVLSQCALEPDLELFQAGDETEVGEKGLTLSGGQKARISLARAVYSKAQVVLLDDVLSALDVHTARSIVRECFAGSLLYGRTVVLVTHNIALTAKYAKYFVTIAADGSISGSSFLADALMQENVQTELIQETETIKKAESVIDGSAVPPAKSEGPKSGGKLIVGEEVALGRVTTRSLKLFLSNVGNPIFWATWLSLNLLNETFAVFLTWWLGTWALAYQEAKEPSDVSVPFYMSRYVLIILVSLVNYGESRILLYQNLTNKLCSAVIWLLFIHGVTRAAKKIHSLLVNSILRSTLRFLDTTPTGRIISRFTQDTQTVDRVISNHLQVLTSMTSAIILKLATIVFFTPVYLAPGLVLAVVAFIVGRIYIAAQLSVKREQSNRRSPVFSTFGAAIGGLTSIRAYGAQTAFQQELLRHVDAYMRSSRAFYNLNRWISVRVDFMGAIFSASLAIHLVYYVKATNASITGLQLSQAIAFSSLLLWWVRYANDMEVSANSLERIQNYLDIDHEAPPSTEGIPPAAWPTSGTITVKNLSARYSADGPEVLHKLSFTVHSGEKIGVVGRTGSGKSSLTLSLLRLIPTQGNVFYDGRDTTTINLEDLRRAVTIIPQQPELLSGTIRQNLDPFSAHDDAALNDALRSAGLFNLQAELPEDERITLDSKVGSGGENFSLGQRQIIALARALVRHSKVLILDEATASLDHATDNLIQETLKTEFKDATLITVAHRLQTIMSSDKIMVLDAGKVVEYNSPKKLLDISGGVFKALVDGSGDRENLYRMAA
ncbi:ATP-binding cassette transporter [Clavulina sp. PMI_390]|nr:ATP-binding cassette transporter [Clavulina sp. PMI_390]